MWFRAPRAGRTRLRDMAQYMEQHSSNEDSNKQVQPVQKLLPSRPVIQPNETIIIDDDDDIADGSCPDVGASVSKPPDHIKLAEESSGKSGLEVTNQDHNNVSNGINTRC